MKKFLVWSLVLLSGLSLAGRNARAGEPSHDGGQPAQQQAQTPQPTAAPSGHPVDTTQPLITAMDELDGNTEIKPGGDYRKVLRQFLILLNASRADLEADKTMDPHTKQVRIQTAEGMMRQVLALSDAIEKDDKLKKLARVALAMNFCAVGEVDFSFLPLIKRSPITPGIKVGGCATLAMMIKPQWPHLAVPVVGLAYVVGGQGQPRTPVGTNPFEGRLYTELMFANPLNAGAPKYKLDDLKGIYTGITVDGHGPLGTDRMQIPKKHSFQLHGRLPYFDMLSLSLPISYLGRTWTDDPRSVHGQADLYYFSPVVSSDGSAKPLVFSGNFDKEIPTSEQSGIKINDPQVEQLLKNPDEMRRRIEELRSGVNPK